MFVSTLAIPVQPASLVLNASSASPSSPARSTGIEVSQADAQTQRQIPDDHLGLDDVLRDNRSAEDWSGQNDGDQGLFGQMVPRPMAKYAGMLPADYTIIRPHSSYSDQCLRHGDSDQPVSKVSQIVTHRDHAFHENLPGRRAENGARDAQDPNGLQQSSHDLRIRKAFQKLSILGRSPETISECGHLEVSACSSWTGSQLQSGEVNPDMLPNKGSDYDSPHLNGVTIAPDHSSHERAATREEDFGQQASLLGDGSSAATGDPWQMELEEAMIDGSVFRNGDPMLRSQQVRLLSYTPSQTALASASFSPNAADAKKGPALLPRRSSAHNDDSNQKNGNASLRLSSLESLGERINKVSDGQRRRGCGGKTEWGRVSCSSPRGSFFLTCVNYLSFSR